MGIGTLGLTPRPAIYDAPPLSSFHILALPFFLNHLPLWRCGLGRPARCTFPRLFSTLIGLYFGPRNACITSTSFFFWVTPSPFQVEGRFCHQDFLAPSRNIAMVFEVFPNPFRMFFEGFLVLLFPCPAFLFPFSLHPSIPLIHLITSLRPFLFILPFFMSSTSFFPVVLLVLFLYI